MTSLASAPASAMVTLESVKSPRSKDQPVPVDARVLIVARDDGVAGPLARGLDQLGWRSVTARGPYAAVAALADLAVDAAVIDLDSCGPDAAELGRRFKAAVAPRRLPVLAIGHPGAEPETAGDFDLVLAAPVHPSQVALRLESLTRMAVAEEEFALRVETFADQGRRLDLPDDPDGGYRVLAVGEPAPQFLALSNALSRGGAEVVGAFTAYTAFDYLHERAFEAVVLWGGENQSEALSIAAGMRRNSRLYHVPAILYLKEGSQVTHAEAYGKGVSDVASPDSPAVETSARVLELARAYRRQHAIRTALERARSSGLMDPATGLFTRDLFASHLARLSRASRERRRPLSVCVLKVAEKPELIPIRREGWIDRAIPQIGSMIGRLVRAEDTAARLGPEVFGLALPATRMAQAVAAGERIAAVIACTAFEAGPSRPAFVVEFDIGVAEVDPDENAARALERAAAKALQRQAG
jgi:two-component system, cell cycle response regulator PopA